MSSPYLENYILLNRVEKKWINKLNKNQVFEWNVINLVFKKYQKDLIKEIFYWAILYQYFIHMDIKPQNIVIDIYLFA